MATGHNSALIDSDGKRYVVCHTRFNNGTERHAPLTLNDVSYSGLLTPMKDEAGIDVLVFSVVGQNESIWGVRYHP